MKRALESGSQNGFISLSPPSSSSQVAPKLCTSTSFFTDQIANALNIKLNQSQRQAILAPKSQNLFLVVGPGSGKTTVIALRILKLILVNNVPPERIIATTFTRRAAKELRSRILDYGMRLSQFPGKPVNLNAIYTDTLDSLVQTFLNPNRLPGLAKPQVIENFFALALIKKKYLQKITKAENQYPQKLGYTSLYHAIQALESTRARIVHNMVDREKYSSSRAQNILSVIESYENYLRSQNIFDFPMLEEDFYTQLSQGKLAGLFDEIEVILVDEYQDTNLLQEQIYFELAKIAIRNGGGLTVVGDDDQSIYRFRGATVDLFQGFHDKLQQQLKTNATQIFLMENYRSTKNIVDFCNSFIKLDRAYQSARISGKPSISFARSSSYNPPILAMFRSDIQKLAEDLADFIADICIRGGYKLPDGNIIKGSVGDCALLCHSPPRI